MKSKLMLIVATFAFALISSGTGKDVPKEPEDLERLRQAYLQKRAEAVKPVNAWYQAQLEALQRRLTQSGDLDGALAIRREMDALRDSLAQEGDLQKALLANKWSWTDKPNDKGVQMTFHEDGTVSHIGMHGTWEITGSRDVTITTSAGDKIVLRFDLNLKSYNRPGGKIHGRTWQ